MQSLAKCQTFDILSDENGYVMKHEILASGPLAKQVSGYPLYYYSQLNF